ncbi:MAG: hypothetical protein JSR82_01135 [Verrucomicrobia bacterium]|nr:hypothetical protein [Verrucomicrobiota bacterium]
MPLSIRLAQPEPSRPCRFALSLQGDRVFADFDLQTDGRVVLRRISFDGHGCCERPFRALSGPASAKLLQAVAHDALEGPEIAHLLRSYLRENADLLWADALQEHGLGEDDSCTEN